MQKAVCSVDTVRAYLKEQDIDNEVVELTESAATAQKAAEALGTSVSQIAKSLVFRGTKTMNPLLVIASGSNRVDERKIARLLSETVEKADADFVQEQTGYSIGGVPPVAHVKELTILIDEDLLNYEEIWAAAGHPNAVFKLTPAQLVHLTKAMTVDVKQAK